MDRSSSLRSSRPIHGPSGRCCEASRGREVLPRCPDRSVTEVPGCTMIQETPILIGPIGRPGCQPLSIVKLRLSTPSLRLADEVDVSLLACLETLAALTMLGAFMSRFGLQAATVPLVLAPLMFLRTRKSISYAHKVVDVLGARIYGQWVSRARGLIQTKSATVRGPDGGRDTQVYTASARVEGHALAVGLRSLVAYSVVLPLVSVVMLGIKVWSALVGLRRWPMATLASVPGNFRYFALQLDLTVSPELVPGVVSRRYQFRYAHPRTAEILVPYQRIRRASHEFRRAVFLPGLAVYLIAIVAPALLYRLILKGSVLIYWPLILCSGSYFQGIPFRDLRTRVLESPVEQFGRVFALLVLALFLGKVALFNLGVVALGTAAPEFVAVFYDKIVSPLEVPVWQVTSVLAALLVWGQWLNAKLSPSSRRATRRAQAMAAVGCACAFYTSAINVLLLPDYVSVASHMSMPPLGPLVPPK